MYTDVNEKIHRLRKNGRERKKKRGTTTLKILVCTCVCLFVIVYQPLMQNPSLKKNNNNSIYPLAVRISRFIPFSKVFDRK